MTFRLSGRLAWVVLIAAFTLVGCYLPGSFDAQIEFSRNGLYKMQFDGYIVDVNLYNDLRQNKLKPDEEKARVANVIDDFKRDADTKDVSYFGKGAFHVVWSKAGDITASNSKMITFFRRNEEMLSVTYNEDAHTVTIAGKYIKKEDAKRIQDMGLDIKGIIRIKTDAQVKSHNAQKVLTEGAVRVYYWELKSAMDTAPKMVIPF